jgi:hypothetical protein
MGHPTPRRIYLDYWDMIRELHMDEATSKPEEDSSGKDVIQALAACAVEFFISAYDYAEGLPDRGFIALQLTGQFIKVLHDDAPLDLVGDSDDADQGQ